MKTVEVGEDNGGRALPPYSSPWRRLTWLIDTGDGGIEHRVIERDLGLLFTQFGLADLGAGDLQIFCRRPLQEGIEGVLGHEQIAASLAYTKFGLSDLGEGGGDLGFVGALLRQRQLSLGDLIGDGCLLQLDGLGHCAGVGEALDLVIGALGLAHVDGGLADLGFLDGKLGRRCAGQQLDDSWPGRWPEPLLRWRRWLGRR